jgi:hypothetical protein
MENFCRAFPLAGVEDHMLGVGVGFHGARDGSFDPGFLERLADRGLGD